MLTKFHDTILVSNKYFAPNGFQAIYTYVELFAASTTLILASWPTHARRSPLAENDTLCTQPPEREPFYISI